MATLLIGLTSLLLLLVLRRFVPRWPRALVVVALNIIASSLLHMTAFGVQVVGHVPTGLPAFTPPSVSADTPGHLALRNAGSV